MLEEYVIKGKKKLRCGVTTGTCAAAAAKAAAFVLLEGAERLRDTVGRAQPEAADGPEKGGRQFPVEILTPSGIRTVLQAGIVSREKACAVCAVQKDAGDDADVTDKACILARVTKTAGGFGVEGGEGVGRVTKPGLDQPVGTAAINSTPRRMILQALEEAAEQAGYEGGLTAEIMVPEGRRLAERTFNPRLGIEGGISILGTSGIVEPMSEAALVDTIRAQISQQAAQGKKALMLAPGNYGQAFLQEKLGLDLEAFVKCSNFIGEAIDLAGAFGMEKVLLAGHIGKLVKLGSGIFHTHSSVADGRMETLCACLIEAGGNAAAAGRLLGCGNTEEALEGLRRQALLEPVMERLMQRIEAQLIRRAGENMQVEAVVFSNRLGLLGRTSGACRLIEELGGIREEGGRR